MDESLKIQKKRKYTQQAQYAKLCKVFVCTEGAKKYPLKLFLQFSQQSLGISK